MASLPVGMHSRASNAGLQMHQMSFQTHSVDGPVVCAITLCVLECYCYQRLDLWGGGGERGRKVSHQECVSV